MLSLLAGFTAFGGPRSPAGICAAAVAVWALALAAPRWSRAAVLPFVPFAAWCALSGVASAQPAAALLPLCRGGLFLGFLLVLGAEADARLRRAWAPALLASGAACAAAALWTGGRGWLAEGTANDMTGFLPPYYNYTAFVEAAAASAAVALLLRSAGESRQRKALIAALAAALAIMLLMARARGALLAFLAACAFTAARRGDWRRLGRLAAAAAAAAVLVTGAAMALTGVGSAYLLKLEKKSVFARPAIWRAAVKTAADHPLLGEGPGSFEAGYLRHREPSDFRGLRFLFTTPYAHSEPLQIAAETGFVGLLLLLLGFWLSRPRLGRADAGPEREAAAAAAVAMLAFCVVDDFSQLPALGLWLLSAWILAGPLPDSAKSDAVAPGAARRLAAAAALGLSLTCWMPIATLRHAEEGAPAERLAHAQAAARVFPATADAHGALVRAWLAQTPPRPDLAWPELVTARRLDPFNALYPGMAGEFARAKGDRAQEGVFAREALALEPNFTLARIQLAESFAHSGDRVGAQAQLDEARRRRDAMDPDGCSYGYGAEICGRNLVIGVRP